MFERGAVPTLREVLSNPSWKLGLSIQSVFLRAKLSLFAFHSLENL